MAAAILLDGPSGNGFTGHMSLGGFSCNTQMGRARFNGTGTTCTMPLFGGGMTGTPVVMIQYNVVDKTIVPSVSGSTLTLTRTDTTADAAFNYQILYFQ